MQFLCLLNRSMIVTIVWATLLGCVLAAQTSSNKGVLNDPDVQQATALYKQNKTPEAAALLEKLVVKYPNDSGLHEMLGASLTGRSRTQSDPEKAKADLLAARAQLLRAKELGDNSDLCNVLLSMIPEDGSTHAFSENHQIDAIMQKAEAEFSKGNFDEAIKQYKLALEIDPRLYAAALYLGDTYFKMGNQDLASEWFAKAIAIDPAQETAYRYWGDSLMKQGKMNEARTKFIEALVANPYSKATNAGMHGWLVRNNLQNKRIDIKLPEAPTADKKDKNNVNITIDPSTTAKKDDGSAAWLMYSMCRARWMGEQFRKEFPEEKEYRHSLKEEVDALSGTVNVFHELTDGKNKSLDSSLVLLSQIKQEGLLEPFVLLLHADQGIAQDYLGYETAHRDKLIQFLDQYVVPPAP